MNFESILFCKSGTPIERNTPAFFHDLNLDQTMKAIAAVSPHTDLLPFFYTHLTDLDSIVYRQEVMRDLENKVLFQAVQDFCQQMQSMYQILEQEKKAFYKYEKMRRFLGAVEIYYESIVRLGELLPKLSLNSRGMLDFREYITAYAESDLFIQLEKETSQLKSDLSAIKYCLLIKDTHVTVRYYDSELDYTPVIEEAFEKFRRGVVKDYRAKFPRWDSMNHIEAQVLDRVVLLYPEPFRALEEFCTKHTEYLDKVISKFASEIQFYISYLVYIEPLRNMELSFCYPEISDTNKEINSRDAFDLALASKLVHERTAVVCNSFYLRNPERIFVVSGPNQGGKTTFARMLGQMHYLASLGCPVPGAQAKLFLFDHLFSHFEKEEDIRNLRGKLQDDLVRIHQTLDVATSNSIIIMNEPFSSTSLRDEIYLSKMIMKRISDLDLLAVCVTFVDELASFNEKTVSMVSSVYPDNPMVRTYKVERMPASGLAYALAIAEKYQVTYNWIKKRLRDGEGRDRRQSDGLLRAGARGAEP